MNANSQPWPIVGFQIKLYLCLGEVILSEVNDEKVFVLSFGRISRVLQSDRLFMGKWGIKILESPL